MANEALLTYASNHISIYNHFIGYKVERGEILLKYVPSKDNVADIFTKGIRGQLHNSMYRSIGIDVVLGTMVLRSSVEIFHLTFQIDIFSIGDVHVNEIGSPISCLFTTL